MIDLKKIPKHRILITNSYKFLKTLNRFLKWKKSEPKQLRQENPNGK